MATKWAICGAGKISWDFCTAMKALPKGEHEVVAVAARDGKRAADFASHFNIASSFDSYDAIAQLKDVDVVYIGVIHTGHVDLSLKMIQAGKNVVCEKPMALTLEGARKVVKAAQDKGVFFLEAYWTRFFPAYKFLRQQIDLGNIGEVKVIEASFCQNVGNVARVSQKELGGGALMDFGCYPVQIANLFFKGKPEVIQSMTNSIQEGKTDLTGVIHLRYGNDRFASLVYSGETGNGENSLVIRGTKGNFKISDYCWCPDHVILPTGERKDFPLLPLSENEKFNFGHSVGLAYEIQCVRECLQKGLTECPEMPHQDSLTITEIICQVLETNGLTYAPSFM